MNINAACRHLSSEDLYRTILLEEGCDVEAPRRIRPVPAPLWTTLSVNAADSARWLPRLRLWFGDSFAG